MKSFPYFDFATDIIHLDKLFGIVVVLYRKGLDVDVAVAEEGKMNDFQMGYGNRHLAFLSRLFNFLLDVLLRKKGSSLCFDFRIIIAKS